MTLPRGFLEVSGVMVWLMSDGELTRLEVLRDLDQRRLTTEAAARLLRLERRQVFRLLKAYRTTGPAGLISKRRGRRGNRRKPEALRKAALAIIREWYWDFGPTLAAEKLREVHGITLGRETLRLWIKRGCGSIASSGGSVSISPVTAAIASASWSRLTAASTGGSRIAGRNARCSCSSTTRPGVHQGLLRHSAAVKRTAKEGEPNGRNDGEGRDGAGGLVGAPPRSWR